jgi:hypothetical protein
MTIGEIRMTNQKANPNDESGEAALRKSRAPAFTLRHCRLVIHSPFVLRISSLSARHRTQRAHGRRRLRQGM